MFNTTKALVLREVRYKEADRMLTLFTSTDGKITAKARGALRKGSKTAAATQQLTYSEMTLFGNRGKWTVNEASVIEPFSGLRTDIADFALGCYFAECLEALSVEDNGDGVAFHVFCYNVQPGVVIDYATGESHAAEQTVSDEQACYVLNTSSHKFHLPDCQGAATIKEENRQDYTGSRDLLIESGFEPCKICNP